MLYLVLSVLALGGVLGLLRGGRPRRLTALPFRGLWIPVMALGIQVFLFAIPFAPGAEWAIGPIHVLSYLLLVLFVLLNRRLPGLLLIGIGIAMNAIVIATNGGAMPVSQAALESAGAYETIARLQSAERSHKSALMNERTLLPVLGDWLSLSLFRTIISPGDVVVGLGGVLFVAAGMTRQERATPFRG